MNDVIREFLIETHENLGQLDLDLVALEKNPTDRETLGRAFRTLHTVKGTAGFLGLQKLQAVSHAAENLLSRLRDGSLTFNAEIAGALLASVDAIRQMLVSVEADETDGEVEFALVIHLLGELCKADGGTTLPNLATRVALPTPAPAAPAARVNMPPPLAQAPAAAVLSPTIVMPQPPPPVAPKTVVLVDSSSPPPQQPPAESPSTFIMSGDASSESRVSAVSDSSIRVDVGLLDSLMNLVGELVLARNQIMQFAAAQEDSGLAGTVQRLNLLTTELQAGVMKTRMQPIGNLWSKFPRVVRDLAVACGKQARIEMDGQETELDKTIIEAIRDPLTHLVRNAVDHGLESPEARVAVGKAPEGRLRLHAFHEGGKVIIEIADDGGGIDPQKIKAKALRNGLIAPEQAERLNERELVNLIFLPGFSTAEAVTQFSGRGVGMDVVRSNVERIGGTVTIESTQGAGTKMKMKIPLTLAIIPALTISSGGDRYAIPQVSLLELVRLEGESAARGVERVQSVPVYRLRGNLLPLVYLDRELRHAPAHPVTGGAVHIVVLQADDRQFGLVVDAIHDTEEIVVKPLQKQLKGIGIFAGATIMGDGKVALILDVLGLGQHANVVSGVRERSLTENSRAAGAEAERQTLLLFATRGGGRMAMPLDVVARLEEFPRDTLEKVGEQYVVQYRGDILPLVQLSRLFRNGRKKGKRRPKNRLADRNGCVQVVVYADAGRRVGLVVDRIIDIVEEAVASKAPASRPGVLFSAVIQGRVTEFIDLARVVGAPQPNPAGV